MKDFIDERTKIAAQTVVADARSGDDRAGTDAPTSLQGSSVFIQGTVMSEISQARAQRGVGHFRLQVCTADRGSAPTPSVAMPA